MAITIDPYVAQLAQGASSDTGLDINVVLTHWNAEEGVASTSQWPDNNPAGLRPGDQADQYSIGVNANNFLMFATPAAGAKAYAVRINTDINYAGVRAAIKTGSPLAELNAIIQSPWDSGHYGGDGHSLYESYSAITGTKYTVPSGLTFDLSTSYAIGDPQSGIANQVSFPASDYSVVANSQRSGNVLYGRRYRILVSNSSGIALDVSDLHCTFDIQTVINQTPPFSTVIIYNLNPETENFLLNYGDKIVVEAGYEGSQYGVIFDGDVIEPIRDKADNVTYRLTINALASNRQLNQAFANFTVARGQTARSLVQNLASKASVPSPLGELSPMLSNAKLPRGKAVFGLARDYYRQIAQANKVAFTMHDSRINLIHASDPPKGTIIDLTPSSGLVGQPVQQDLGVSFQCLLNPAITINSLVHIDNSLIQAQTFQIGEVQRPLDAAGIYRVVGVEHVGDTRSTEWYTNCTTVSQAGGIPGMLSTTSGNPWY